MPPAPDEPVEATDALRDQLLDAAARVFARNGYDGTKIQDIVKEAGLSSGAVYGRFSSKDQLLREAVITRSVPQGRINVDGLERVADIVERGARFTEHPLSDAEALLLETYVAARREPDIAEALIEADRRWHLAVAPLVEAAVLDGTIVDGVDPEAVLFLTRVLRLGLLLHRGSALPSPSPAAWESLLARVVASFGEQT